MHPSQDKKKITIILVPFHSAMHFTHPRLLVPGLGSLEEDLAQVTNFILSVQVDPKVLEVWHVRAQYSIPVPRPTRGFPMHWEGMYARGAARKKR